MTDERYLHLLRQDCPLPPGTHVILYTRDSGGEEQDRSTTQQREAAEEYCARFGLVLEKVYDDEAQRATNVLKREQFNQMMHDLRKRFPVIHDPLKRAQRAESKPFGVLCWKSNRLGRDLVHTRNIKSDIRLRAVTIVPLTPIVETGDPGLDSLMESFHEYQDEKRLEEISEDAKRGLAELVTLRDTNADFLLHNPDWQPTGGYLSIMPGGVPRGFKGERIRIGTYERKKGRKSGEPHIVQRLVPDPELWDRCYLAWKMRREGATIREIMEATRLYKDTSGYSSFFENLIYTGILEYGGNRLANFVPALIPMEWWIDEQARKRERGKKLKGEKMQAQLEPRRVGGGHLLSNLLFCGAVEGHEHPIMADAIPAKKGVRGHWDFYICSVKKNSRGQKCTSARVGARILEQSVIDCLLRDVLTLETLRPLANVIAQELEQTNQEAGVRLVAAQAELSKVERQVKNLLEAIEEMGLSPSLRDQLAKREAEKEKLRTEITLLESLIVKTPDIPRITDAMIEEWLTYIRAALKSDDLEIARRAIRQFVSKIVIANGEGDIYYTFPMPTSPQGRRHLGERSMDLRGFEPLTSTVRL